MNIRGEESQMGVFSGFIILIQMLQIFWKAVSLNKTSNTSVPSPIMVNDCLLSDHKEINLDFNKHFIAAQHQSPPTPTLPPPAHEN